MGQTCGRACGRQFFNQGFSQLFAVQSHEQSSMNSGIFQTQAVMSNPWVMESYESLIRFDFCWRIDTARTGHSKVASRGLKRIPLQSNGSVRSSEYQLFQREFSICEALRGSSQEDCSISRIIHMMCFEILTFMRSEPESIVLHFRRNSPHAFQKDRR